MATAAVLTPPKVQRQRLQRAAHSDDWSLSLGKLLLFIVDYTGASSP